MRVQINGKSVDVEQGITVRDALELRGLDPEQRGIAVAVDGRVIQRHQWEECQLTEGARVEIVTAKQGG